MSGITAVVLSYNKAKAFPRFVRSFMRQTIMPNQVIIVDDASTDGVQAQIHALPAPWIKEFLPKNGGQSRARNVGARRATGEYIIFLDGDLEMHRTMIAMLYHALRRNPKGSIAYCHYNRQGTRTDPVRAIPYNAEELRRINYISMMSMIRRKDMPMPPFDESLRRYEDWDLWRRMARKGHKGVLVNQVLFTAFYHEGDLSAVDESKYWYDKVIAKKQGP